MGRYLACIVSTPTHRGDKAFLTQPVINFFNINLFLKYNIEDESILVSGD